MHAKYALEKTLLPQVALPQALPNTDETRHVSRVLIAKVISLVVLYGTPAWATALMTAAIIQDMCREGD